MPSKYADLESRVKAYTPSEILGVMDWVFRNAIVITESGIGLYTHSRCLLCGEAMTTDYTKAIPELKHNEGCIYPKIQREVFR